MDRVRLGRVLGKGARGAARTAWEALDAATATPPPTRTPTRTPATAAPNLPEILRPVGQNQRHAEQTAARPLNTEQVIGKGAAALQGATRGVAGPLRNASRALWHELTGSFFALFALSFFVGAWKWHAGIHGTAFEQRRFYVALGLGILFLYFSVSSFIRANRKPA